MHECSTWEILHEGGLENGRVQNDIDGSVLFFLGLGFQLDRRANALSCDRARNQQERVHECRNGKVSLQLINGQVGESNVDEGDNTRAHIQKTSCLANQVRRKEGWKERKRNAKVKASLKRKEDKPKNLNIQTVAE